MKFCLILFCLWLSCAVSGQTVDSCKSAAEPTPHLNNLVALTDYDIAPMEFLFSYQGVDVYSATSYRRPDPEKWISQNGLTVILVYQAEAARQKQIAYLRSQTSLPARIGFPEHIENLKYAMLNFFGPSAAYVRDLEYFEPKQCVTPNEEMLASSLWMSYSDLQIWRMSGLHAYKKGPNWITGFYVPALLVSAKANPLYVKIHNAMVDKVRSYLALHH